MCRRQIKQTDCNPCIRIKTTVVTRCVAIESALKLERATKSDRKRTSPKCDWSTDNDKEKQVYTQNRMLTSCQVTTSKTSENLSWPVRQCETQRCTSELDCVTDKSMLANHHWSTMWKSKRQSPNKKLKWNGNYKK